MGEMALGYGSEFHLLRFMGRHRNYFDKEVMKLIGCQNIEWLDFTFNKNKNIPDSELKGLSFLENDSNSKTIIDNYKNEWPQTGNSMNWDAIGYFLSNGNKTWILVEAKAHLGELNQNCSASDNSLKKIEISLNKAFDNLKIERHKNNSLIKTYYQMANRLYILDLLKRHKINAVLLNIYFTGDLFSPSRKSPKDISGWLPKIKEMKEYLNITDSNLLGIYDLFLNVDCE